MLYLKSLILQNWVTFKQQEIDFSEGLNAIIGETGSGKSLILLALLTVLGHKCEKRYIRKSSDFTMLEATFTCEDEHVKKFFSDKGHPFDGHEFSLKRIIYKSGSAKSYFNFNPCSLSLFVDFSKKFIDWVGQFENQKLLNMDYQLNMLDLFDPSLGLLKQNYAKNFFEFKKNTTELQQLLAREQESTTRADYLNFRLNEISKSSPIIGEEESLKERKKVILEGRGQRELFKTLLAHLSDHGGILPQINKMNKLLQREKNLEFIFQYLQEASVKLNDISFLLSQNLTEDQHESELEEISTRLDQYQKLKIKYGQSVESILNQKQQFEQELLGLQNLRSSIDLKNQEIFASKNECFNLAQQMHSKRLQIAITIEKKLTTLIRDLKLNDATISLQFFQETDLSDNGISSLKFMVETNPGEGLHLLRDIVSGGELSRILLACRQLMVGKELISIFLFDEIDAGVGGTTALSVGSALANVAKSSQVLAITHLPQIATYADKLIIVSKEYELDNSTTSKRTYSSIKTATGLAKKKFIQEMIPLEQ
ncbi:MAG: AAA family ATPase [Oligoflexia bacterium]|nr:AAA family ATPase [Oligoflexia bacterium]